MTCDCCRRTLDAEHFGCDGWCNDCSRGGCVPGGRPSYSCPRVRAVQQRRLGVLANGVRLTGMFENEVRW